MKFPKFKDHLISAGFIIALITMIALYETDTIHPVGKAGIFLAIFFTPVTFYRIYLGWQNREQLIQTYQMAKLQFTAIKAAKKEKTKKEQKKKTVEVLV